MSRRFTTLLCCLAATAALLAPAGAGAVTYEPEPPFCEPAVVQDHLKALGKLPRLSWPENGKLGFAPRASLGSLTQLVVPRKLPGTNRVGYKLGLARDGAATRPDWTVTATLARVSWGGRVLERIGRALVKGKSLGPGSGGGRRWEVGEQPAVYRLTLVFRSSSGKRLASYGRYFRVLPPTVSRRLAVNAAAYRPEQFVYGRVENFGTVATTYGVPYTIERFDSGQWSVAPESPDGPWIMPLLGSLPGKSGECSRWWIPAGTPPGHYRMTKEVDTIFDPDTRTSDGDVLTAEFDVLP